MYLLTNIIDIIYFFYLIKLILNSNLQPFPITYLFYIN